MRRLLYALLLIGLLIVSQGRGQDKTTQDKSDLPPGARFRLGSDRFRISGFIFASAISPDGKKIAYLNQSSQIAIQNLITGRKIRSFDISECSLVQKLFFTPDGKRLVTAGYNGIYVWDCENGKKLHSIPSIKKDLFNGPVSLSNDGTVASFSTLQNNAFVKVMRLADGTELGTINPLHNSTLYSTLSPDGTQVVTWGEHSLVGQVKPADVAIPRCVNMWDVKSSKLLATMDTGHNYVCAACFSPDGKHIAIGCLGSIQLWEISTGKLIRRFACRQNKFQQVQLVFSPDGKFISLPSGQGIVQTWETATGKNIRQFQAPIGTSPNLIYRDDGSLIAWEFVKNALLLWDVTSGNFLTPMGGHRSFPVSLQFSANSKQLVSITYDCEMIRWDLFTGKELESEQRFSRVNPRMVSPIMFSPDEKFFISHCVEGVGTSISETSSKKELFTLYGSSGLIDRDSIFAFSGDSRKFVALSRNSSSKDPFSIIPVWDLDKGVPQQPLKGQEGIFGAAGFSNDGKILSTSSYSAQMSVNDGQIWSWDVDSGRVLSKINTPTEQMLKIVFVDHRTFVTLHRDELNAYDSLTGQQVNSFEKRGAMRGSLMEVSPDRRLIGFGVIELPDFGSKNNSPRDVSRVKVYESATGSVRYQFDMPGYLVSLAFSGDGRWLAVGMSDTSILIYDLEKAGLSSFDKVIGLEKRWQALEDQDASVAWSAMRALIAKPEESVPLIKTRLVASAKPKPDHARISKLIAELDSARYSDREAAMKELEKIAPIARDAILGTIEKKTISLELRERLEKLEELSIRPVLRREAPWRLRAIEVLERINTPAAKEHLKTLAAGGDSAVTSAAREALTRLDGR